MTETRNDNQIDGSRSNSCRVSSHERNLIQYFCLDELCYNKRLFCHACAKLDHKKHRIGRIDRLIEPLSLLNINSFHEDSQSIYEELKIKIEEFYKVINEIRNSFDKTLKEIEKTTFFHVQCILETFSNQKIEEVEELFLSSTPDDQEVKNSISMINFLQFEGVEDCYTVKNVSDIMLCKMTKSLTKTYTKVETIFQKLIRNIKENDFINQLRLYKHNLEMEAKKKMEEGLNKVPVEQDDKASQTQTLDQPQQHSELEKEKIDILKNFRALTKEDKASMKPSLVSKFKAFFEEEEEGELSAKKSKKEKNVILVKKEST